MASNAQAEEPSREATFVVVGAGGLGCPALLGLLAAGARRITIVDHDVVETSNLQRQVLYTVGDLGMSKVEAARLQIRRRCPDVEVRTRPMHLEVADAERFVAALEPESVLLECSDSPALKFALNDAALSFDVPLVVGAALGLRGQALAVARGAACYRCIYESPPPDAPTCAAAGVLGAAVGATGFHMAALAWALAQGRREALGMLWAIDLQTMRTRTLHPCPRRDCPACHAEIPAPAHPPTTTRPPRPSTRWGEQSGPEDCMS